MTEWGIFLFILLILNLGLITMYNRQLVEVGRTDGTLTQVRFYLPLNWEFLGKSFPYALFTALIGFIIIKIFWGNILPQDIVGLCLMVPIITYLIHIIKIMNKQF
ncbi:MAG: hypothetical protein IPJ74_17355 [Saprospiraceae bacterium]|nr:hypothetical protein [Saprospiraceae bacterium]